MTTVDAASWELAGTGSGRRRRGRDDDEDDDDDDMRKWDARIHDGTKCSRRCLCRRDGTGPSAPKRYGTKARWRRRAHNALGTRLPNIGDGELAPTS